MRACFVHADPSRRIAASLPVWGEVIVGRDAGVDLVLDRPSISRRHAAISGNPFGRKIEDLGSSNGTLLNGHPVTSPIPLRAGDTVCFGSEVTLVYEEEPISLRLLVIPALVLLIVLTVAGLGVWYGDKQDPIIEEAAVLAAQGVHAAHSGNELDAKAKLRSAVGLLYKHGYLDSAPRGRGADTAFALIQPHLSENVDLSAIFRDVLKSSRPPPARSLVDAGGCRLDRVGPRELDMCIRERAQQVLVALQQEPRGVPDRFFRRIGERLRREHAFLEQALERGRPLIPMLQRELVAAHLPPDLHYLALIESGYRTKAVSPAGAVGLWQFMPGTARQYGLRVDGRRDERKDPEKSTRAAARYLRDLTFEFGGDALLLALAGYNRGENAVRRALKRLDDPFSDRSFWALVDRGLLPSETVDYLPRFMAAAVAGRAGLPREDVLLAAGY